MYEVKVDERDLVRLVAALEREADGKALRRDLAVGLRAAVEPAAALARGAILSMGSKGLGRATPPLRTAVASAVKVEVRLSSKRAGVSVVVRKHSMPRGFYNAPKRLNAAKGWRHPAFGTDTWVHQIGAPGWFDDSMRAAEPAANRAAKEALDEVARRIDIKTRG